MEHYGFDVFWSDEDEGYIATCPDFPGLSAFGTTEEQAIKEGKAALRLFLEVLEAEGKKAPRATTIQRLRRSSRKLSTRRSTAAL